MAVLYQTGTCLELWRRSFCGRVAYKLVGGVRFYGRAEVKDLLAYLRLVNKEEEISRNQ